MGSLEPDVDMKQELHDSGYVQDDTASKPAMDENRGSPNLLDLSDDVLLYILKNLCTHDLKALGFTCARLGALVLDRTLWVDVDGGDVPHGRKRVRWILMRALGPHTRSLRLTGYAAQATGCLGFLTGYGEEDSDDEPPPAEEERYLCGGPRVYKLTQSIPRCDNRFPFWPRAVAAALPQSHPPLNARPTQYAVRPTPEQPSEAERSQSTPPGSQPSVSESSQPSVSGPSQLSVPGPSQSSVPGPSQPSVPGPSHSPPESVAGPSQLQTESSTAELPTQSVDGPSPSTSETSQDSGSESQAGSRSSASRQLLAPELWSSTPPSAIGPDPPLPGRSRPMILSRLAAIRQPVVPRVRADIPPAPVRPPPEPEPLEPAGPSRVHAVTFVPKQRTYSINNTTCPGPQLTFTHTGLRALGTLCPNLTSLELENCVIDCRTTSIGQFPKTLLRLSLKGTRCFNIEPKTFLFKIQDHLSELEEIDVSFCPWIEPACMLPLSKMPCLLRLHMRECYKLAEFVAYASLATRYGFKQLKVLDLRGSPVGDSEVSALGWLPSLEELYLSPAPQKPPMKEHAHYKQDILPDFRELAEWEEMDPEYFKMSEVSEAEWIQDEESAQGIRNRYYNCEDPTACILLERMIAEPVSPAEYSTVYNQFLGAHNVHNANVPITNPDQYREAYHNNMAWPSDEHPAAGYSLFIGRAQENTRDAVRELRMKRGNFRHPGPSRRVVEDPPWLKRKPDYTKDNDSSSDDDDDNSPTKAARTRTIATQTGPCTKNNNKGAKRSRKIQTDCTPRRVFEITINDRTHSEVLRINNNSEAAANNNNNENNQEPAGPSNVNEQPMDVDQKPIDDDPKPINEDPKLRNEAGPSNVEQKPMDEDPKLINEAGPSNVEQKPMDEDPKPINDDPKFLNEAGPSNVEQKPMEEDHKPSNDERNPLNEEPAGPSNGEAKPKKQGNYIFRNYLIVTSREAKKRLVNLAAALNKVVSAEMDAGNTSEAETPKNDTRDDNNKAENEKANEAEEENKDTKDAKNQTRNLYNGVPGIEEVPLTPEQEERNRILYENRSHNIAANESHHIGNMDQNLNCRFSNAARAVLDAFAQSDTSPRPGNGADGPERPQRRYQFRQFRRPIVIEDFINSVCNEPRNQRTVPRGMVLSGAVLPTERLDHSSLVSDSSIRRFGRAVGENINYLYLGGGPAVAEVNARPDRSNLRILSVTGFRHVTDLSLTHLVSAAPQLRTLDVTGTGVSAQAARSFRAQRPDVTLISNHPDDLEQI